MLPDAIRRWNPWWAEGAVEEELLGIEREKLAGLKKHLDIKLIKDILGVRRSGKTTLLYQLIQHLISGGVSTKDILFLNFDDSEIYSADFEKLLLECRRINPDVSHIFLDEVQEKNGWERWVRVLYDTKQFKQIFVSGSSSSLLKQDVARVLSGRHTTFVMFPFSFREYLMFFNWQNFEWDYLEHNKGKVLHFLERYLAEGGFPEMLGKGKMKRTKYLSDLFDDIVARDAAAKHKADYEIMKKIAYYTISNSSKTMTYRSIANACGVSVDTVSKYLAYLEECYLTLPLRKFSKKLKEQMREINKYYSIDTGLANAVGYRFTEEFGRVMENAVFIELNRRFAENKKMGLFYLGRDGEVDFVVREGQRVRQLIQVCYGIEDPKTKKREIKPLLMSMNEFKLRQGLVITWDVESEEREGGKKIVYKPLWKWMIRPTATLAHH